MTPTDCVKVMVAVKLGRAAYKYKRDSLRDLVGYTAIWDLLEEDKLQGH
jgi:hypothetical protein